MSEIIGSELIKLIGAVLVIVIPLVWGNARSNKKVTNKLGEPNGHGDIVSMIADLDARMSAQHRDIRADIEVIRNKVRIIADHIKVDV